MAILAVLITYIGALNVPGNFRNDSVPQDPAWQDISHVYDVYGPGQFLSWLLAVGSLHYDCYNRPLHDYRWLDKTKLLGVGMYASFAIFHYMLLTLRQEFGPDHAAARQVADKTYESAALIYFLVS